MDKRVQTVKGNISPETLGKTITHEHMLWDLSCWWPGEPEEVSEREFIHQKICLENRGWIVYNPNLNLDNIIQHSIDIAADECMHFKRAGGGTIVDLTSIGIGRDPKALLAISESTGVNIVMGSGFYIESSYPNGIKNMKKEEIAKIIINEFAYGVKDTGIKPGVIGEIGIQSLQNPEELKMVKAASIAQKETGAPLYIHPPFEPVNNNVMGDEGPLTEAGEILDVIEKEGADLSKVVMCHCDPSYDKPDYHDSIAKRGAYIEFDQFGFEFVSIKGFCHPRDMDRIKAIKHQISRGNLERIIVSQDTCFKVCLLKYGGWGYGHILREIVPLMKRQNISNDELNIILHENPKRLLAF
jgi:phosphotriesterase-related protein